MFLNFLLKYYVQFEAISWSFKQLPNNTKFEKHKQFFKREKEC